MTHTLVGTMIAAIVFPVASKPVKLKLIQWWSGRLVAALNLRVISLGNIPTKHETLSNTMFVANHISWTDIYALNSIVPLRFISKSEVKSWPVIGYLASKANVLFIDRSRRHDAARVVNTAALGLKAGDNLCFFPEGTTTDGTVLKPFKSSLIEAAIQASATIQPIAIRYPRPDSSINTEVAYAGETTMLVSIQQILRQKCPVVELHFFAPIPINELAAANKDRRALTQSIQDLIQQKLNLKIS
ncbi:MAG: lysophospholipid acyltransferase family protein [Pseudomonadota bacterium]